MKGQNYDLLFAPAAASELAYLNSNLPVIYFGDATYKSYSDTYEKEFKDASIFSKWEGNYLERRALQKSKLIILTLQWAAQSAVQDYKIPLNKIEVMLMGANIDSVPDTNIIFNKVHNKTLTLLFLGVDWERKGGAIAFDTLIQLHKDGIKATLIVCGVKPPNSYTHAYMQVIPFLNKNNTADYNQFVEILSSVHFLIIPTRADCSLLVNAEANAYGVPTITTNIGGVSDVVKDGINGYCLPFIATGKSYAALIQKLFLITFKNEKIIN